MEYLAIAYTLGIVLFLVTILFDKNTYSELNYRQIFILIIIGFIWPIAIILWLLDK